MRNLLLALVLLASGVGLAFLSLGHFQFESNISKQREEERPAKLSLVKIKVSDCKDCFDVDRAVEDFKKEKISLVSEQTLDFDSDEAKKVIKDYEIKKVPTFILKGEVSKKIIEEYIKREGKIVSDNFVYEKVIPIYVDTSENKQRGRVEATYLKDSSCQNCVDVKRNIEAFKRGGLRVVKEEELDSESPQGENFIAKYSIKRVPTYVLSGDLDVYPDFRARAERFGSFLDEGTYVFKEVNPPYKDLEKNKVVGLVEAIYLTDSSCGSCYSPKDFLGGVLTRGYGLVFQNEKIIDVNSAEGKKIINKYGITKAPTVILSTEADYYINLKNNWSRMGGVIENGWYVLKEIQNIGGISYKDLSTNQIIQNEGGT